MDERIELKIDVMDQPEQQALALEALTIKDLIKEVLQEFEELEYLDRGDPTNYEVRRKGMSVALDPTATIQESGLQAGTHLVFMERPLKVPAGAKPLNKLAYLREKQSGKVFRLAWQPAIIGRPDSALSDDDLLAVNVHLFPAGLRVARRQAQITEENGQLFIQSLSRNPTMVNSDVLGDSKVELHPGDEILLTISDISLKLIVRNGSAVPLPG